MNWKWSAAFVLIMCSFVSTSTRAQQGGAKRSTLTAQDYIEIQQLVARYNFALDTCSNNGYDYADLFTADGSYGGPRAQGREKLAEVSGGGSAGCQDKRRLPGPDNVLHVTSNLVIEPSPEGATGKAYVMEIGGGKPSQFVGWFQDVYVKTPDGWRFKTRKHATPPRLGTASGGVPPQAK